VKERTGGHGWSGRLSGEGGVDNPIRCCKNCCCLFLPLPNGFQARFFPLFFDKLPGLMCKMRWKIESVIPFNWTDRNIKRLLFTDYFGCLCWGRRKATSLLASRRLCSFNWYPFPLPPIKQNIKSEWMRQAFNYYLLPELANN